VTFDPVVTASSTWYQGTVHTSPFYDFRLRQPRRFQRPRRDRLRPATGITPGTLPTAVLSQITPRLVAPARKSPATAYRALHQRSAGGGKRIPDFISADPHAGGRTFASLSRIPRSATGSADICVGDSGSPRILSGTNLVVGITAVEWSLAGSECESNPWEQRVDTPAARAFLGQYVALP
jgi:hypothetical protein